MNKVMMIYFLVLAATVIVYYALPLKRRWIALLAFSIVFYAVNSTYLFVFIASTTLSVYFCARYIQKSNDAPVAAGEDLAANAKKVKKHNKTAVVLIIVFNLAIIGVLKYYNFFGGTLNSLFSLMHIDAKIPAMKMLLPLGISFYTLQAIGYLIDVYRKKYAAETNFCKLSLFLIFFPQILEGPISRYDQTADQLYEGHKADYKGITYGLQRILWGLFKKMVVADRLYLLVKTVSDNPGNFSGYASLLFIFCYTLQLYADFSGFIDIAIGSGELFGVKLPENFKRPFFAKSAQEFWKRWHITLGVWLKEYVFYSVALSPKVVKSCGKLKKRWRNHFTKMLPTAIALLAVWLCNGLWHGPEWKYIVYGLYYFVIIVSGMMLEPLFRKLYQKIHLNPDGKAFTVFRHIRTLLIIFIGETIFGANTLGDAFMILSSVFRPYHGSIFSLGMDLQEIVVACLALLLMLGVGIVQEKGIGIRDKVASVALPVRWASYMSLILVILVFGAYGDMYNLVPFIYGNF